MSAEDKHMDDIFRKMAEETNVPYKADFWNEAQAKLADDAMDSAFKAAADNHGFVFTDNVSEAIDDAFLDDAFIEAAKKKEFSYNSVFWSDYLQNEKSIFQDVAFNEAANSTQFDYFPAYWSEADQFLQNEGLHFEYKKAYWNEAKQLLDQSDRKGFFVRWSVAATILLLFSVGGFVLNNEEQNSELTTNLTMQQNLTNTHLLNAKDLAVNSQLLNEIHEDELLELQQVAVVTNHTTNENNSSFNDQNINSAISNGISAETNILTETNQLVILSEDENISSTENLNNNVTEFVQENTLINQEKSDDELSFRFASNEIPSNSFTEVEKPLFPEIEVKPFVLSPVHKFSVIGQAGVGNKYNNYEFMPALRTGLGIEYLHSGFGRLRYFDLGFIASMNHGRQTNLGTERRVNHYNTDGGVDKLWYKLNLKDFIYSNLSAVVAFKADRKNSIRLSFGVDYLMFVQSNMSYQVDPESSIKTVNNNWGVKEGVNKFDLRMGLGFEHKFTDHFSAQMNVNYGFLDRSDDQFLNKSFFDNEVSATVGIKYTIYGGR